MPRNAIIDDDDMLDALVPQRGPDPRVHKATFVGANSKTADLKALERAKQKTSRGKTKEDIWREEGWFRGADGEWRSEVSDHASAFKSRVAEGAREGPLELFLDNPDVYAAYPDVADIPVKLKSMEDGSHGIYNKGSDREWIDLQYPNPGQLQPSAVHEGQHAVSDRAGFGLFTSEQDALATERRLDLTPEQRRERYPWLDYDTSIEDQRRANALATGQARKKFGKY